MWKQETQHTGGPNAPHSSSYPMGTWTAIHLILIFCPFVRTSWYFDRRSKNRNKNRKKGCWTPLTQHSPLQLTERLTRLSAGKLEALHPRSSRGTQSGAQKSMTSSSARQIPAPRFSACRHSNDAVSVTAPRPDPMAMGGSERKTRRQDHHNRKVTRGGLSRCAPSCVRVWSRGFLSRFFLLRAEYTVSAALG
ncbi:hypothetical protein BD289DRAFT_265868 [Coniella lustricola]|uniref:Uncharacterized protein n=1 Tax=Coniella lustricola TaxID=2025994 RepID=A0A2T3A783_9PEZI|nr:hypothetical protein BD289DRAFT_265868 [Coniella lustricola]